MIIITQFTMHDLLTNRPIYQSLTNLTIKLCLIVQAHVKRTRCQVETAIFKLSPFSYNEEDINIWGYREQHTTWLETKRYPLHEKGWMEV